MEGITNHLYRNIILKNYPSWDYVSTDFLRLPTGSLVKASFVIDHIGGTCWNNKLYLNKTIFQILATERTYNQEASKLFEELNIPWIDLNFGCPSKHVNRHHGGAYLLDHPEKIKTIAKEIRQFYHGFLSAKIRIGYHSTHQFTSILNILEGEGIDLITIHPRTKDQMYAGKSDWQYIKLASDCVKVPVIGNGDIETIPDINKMFADTNCHGVMIGRGAIKKPWLINEYKNNLILNQQNEIKIFFNYLINELKQNNLDSKKFISSIKQLAHYLLYNYHEIKNQILHCQNISEILTLIDQVAR
ncbi:MAG: hypothetical protein A2381_09975 [Bdellovibrionales bacterium RIFOXYB1_FULL_37_110]|nr:MAG: hypothetical protein A2417_08435 [Bdellovibrionales bacterium RIFOXYC1_FULL_37_79]OFZ59596.1 MAG: hypothetical protein A2381_09975 [Bdellovibrionales bacterium RIFOXYB1_FULL_37_110]